MKPSFIAETLSLLAKTFGLAQPSTHSDIVVEQGTRSPEDVKRALAAARRIREQAREMKLGVTDADILSWIKEGRR